MLKQSKADKRPLLAHLLEVDENDSRHIPFLLTTYLDYDTWRSVSPRYYRTWAGVLHLPRVQQRWTLIANIAFVVICVGLFVIAGTPIRGVTYTWWLLVLALLTLATFGLNTAKMANYFIRGSKRHGK